MKKYKIDYNQYLLDDYIVGDTAVIKVLIDDKDSLYNKLDPRKMLLDKSILNYITEEAYKIPYKYNISIELCTSSLADSEKSRVAKIIKNYYAAKVSNCDSVIKINVIKSLCFILLGTLMIIYSFLGYKFFGPVYEEIIMIVGWVLTWEGVDLLLLSNNE